MKLVSSSPKSQHTHTVGLRAKLGLERMRSRVVSTLFITRAGLADAGRHCRRVRFFRLPHAPADAGNEPAAMSEFIGDNLEATRLRTVLVTIALSVLTVVLLRDRPWSDGRTALALNAVAIGIFLWHVAFYKDKVMARLLLFGLGLGIVELVADALCVRFTRTLDYTVAHTPLLGLSPFWMPTAWMVVAAQIGYLGHRLIAKLGTAGRAWR